MFKSINIKRVVSSSSAARSQEGMELEGTPYRVHAPSAYGCKRASGSRLILFFRGGCAIREPYVDTFFSCLIFREREREREEMLNLSHAVCSVFLIDL